MRILMLNHNVAWKGTFLRCYHLGRHMAQAGHTVTVVTTSPTRKRGISSRVDAGVEIVETPSVLCGGPRSGFDPWTVWQRLGYLQGRKFDVVHAFDSRPTVIHPALQSARENPQALFVMDWADWWGQGGSIRERSGVLFERTLGRIEAYYEEAFRLRAHAATVISRALEGRLIGLGYPARRIHRIPHGCDLQGLRVIEPERARAELPSLPDGLLVGYLGVLMPPDAVLLGQAFERLRQRLPSTLVLIGNHRLPASHPLLRAPHVVATGTLPYADVNRALCACDALVLPLQDNISNRGRWPSKLNDYLCVSRPIVATAMGEVDHLLGPHDAGILVRDEADAVAAGLAEALTNRARARRIAENALSIARDVLPWERLTQGLLRFYAEQMGIEAGPPLASSPEGSRRHERELVVR
jgi:glycosyltransferase involved in cell wall biosynthesis